MVWIYYLGILKNHIFEFSESRGGIFFLFSLKKKGATGTFQLRKELKLSLISHFVIHLRNSCARVLLPDLSGGFVLEYVCTKVQFLPR